MFRVLRLNRQTIENIPRNHKNLDCKGFNLVEMKCMFQKRSPLWFYLTLLLWIIDAGVFIAPSWSQKLPRRQTKKPSLTVGQQPISLPQQEQLTPTEPRTPASSIPTFSPDNPPPFDYSPPNFDKNSSRQFSTYRLDTGDGISINVPSFPEFNTVVNIDQEGHVIMPILGRITLAGLTLSEAEEKIIQELNNRYLQERPAVFVSLTVPRPAQITILGEVVRPGFYSFVSGSPLNVALTAAGGSTQDADLRSVIIRRSLVDGTVVEREIDLYTPLIKTQALPDVRLQGGDTIIVSKLEVGKDRDYDQALVARTTLPQQTITVRIVAPLDRGGNALRNINLPNGSTFLDVIATLPGGDGILIKVGEVALMRFDREQGKVVTQVINTRTALRGDLAQNVNLQDEDVIIVSRTLIGRVFNAFTVLTRPIRDFLSFRSFFDFLFD